MSRIQKFHNYSRDEICIGMLYLRLSGLGDLQVTVPTEVTGVRTGSRNATNGRVRWARWQQGLRGAVQGVDFADAGLSLGTVCWLFAVQCKEDTSSHGLISQFSKIIFMFLFAATLHQAACGYEGMSCYYGFEGHGTGWDPWLGGCVFFQKVASSWLVDVCFVYRA